MEPFQYNQIKRQRKIGKPIEATVKEISKEIAQKTQKPYLRLTLNQGQSTIIALAFNLIYIEQWMSVLTKGESYKFPEGTFKAVTRDQKYPSESNQKFDLYFISEPQTESTPQVGNSSSGLGKAIVRSKKRGGFEFKNIEDLEFNSAVKPRIFRYWGCPKCKGKILRKSEKNVCKNWKTCDGMNNGPKQLCIPVIQDIVVQDLFNNTLKNVSSFDSDFLLNLLGISYENFSVSSDEEIQWKFEQSLISGFKFQATIKRSNKKPGSKYDASILLDNIKLPQDFEIKQCSETFHYEPVLPLQHYSNDDGNYSDGEDLPPQNEFAGKKKNKNGCRQKVKELLGPAGPSSPAAGFSRPKLPPLNIENWHPKTAVHIKGDYVYPVNSNPRGLVLLINNKNYPPTSTGKNRIRHGSEVDVKNLTCFFKKMNFQIYTEKAIEDVTYRKNLAAIISDYKEELIRSNVDSSIIIVMGHGNHFEIGLVGNDPNQNTANLMRDIIEPMICTNFNKFGDKPRIFIVEACQGFAISEYTRNLKLTKAGFENVLVCLPGLPGFKTWRTPEGSYFIYYLIKVIQDYGMTTDIKEILHIVQIEMRSAFSMQNDTTISVPYCDSWLFNKFYFIGNNEKNNQMKEEDALVSDFEDMEVH